VPVVCEEWQLLCKLLRSSSFHGIPWGFVDDDCLTWDMAIKTVVCTCTSLVMALNWIAKEVNDNAHISIYYSIPATLGFHVHVFLLEFVWSFDLCNTFIQLDCSDRVVLCVVTRGLYFICTVVWMLVATAVCPCCMFVYRCNVSFVAKSKRYVLPGWFYGFNVFCCSSILWYCYWNVTELIFNYLIVIFFL